MKKYLLLLILLAVGMVNLSTAQVELNQINPEQHTSNWCGSNHQDNVLIKERLMKNRIEMANWADTRTAVIWVPVKFHLVGNSGGGNHVSELQVFEMLCAVNEDYLDQEIQFYVKDGSFKYINNTITNTDPRSNAGAFQLGASKVSTALNIYIVETIMGASGGNTLGYYDPNPGADWIVLQRDQVSALAAETLTHELGHFFSLPHPFFGWDGEYWQSSLHGNPVGPLSPNGVVNEFVNGNNCMSAADGICDTEANYGLGFGWNGCNYSGGVMDPNGDLLDPQESNYMAYFIGCGSEFTPDQKVAMNVDLASSSRNYLGAGNVTPESDAITVIPNLLSPINGEVTPLFNVVNFAWDAVPNATHYFVEVDRTPAFNSAPEATIVSGTSTVFEDVFDDDRTYYWRVKAFNRGNVCGPITEVQSFRTGMVSPVNEIASVKEWKVSPNPIHNNQILNVGVITDSSFDAEVKLFNVSGKLIQTQAHTFSAGSSNLEVSVENLPMGMYMLYIESEAGVLNEKIVVTR